MTETYTVKGEYLFITDAPKILAEIADGFEKAMLTGERFRSALKEIGEQSGSIRRLARALKEVDVSGLRKAARVIRDIDTSSLSGLSGEARSAALSFNGITSAITAAREQMRLLVTESGRLSSVHVGQFAGDAGGGSGGGGDEGGNGGGGGSGSGRRGAKNSRFRQFRKVIGADIPGYHSPGLATFLGGTALYEGMKESFNAYADTQQAYDIMLSDSKVRTDPAVMKAIRDSADLNLERYRTLAPMDAVRNAVEGYALSGGEMREQLAISDMLGRIEQNMILRGKSGDEAQREAKALVRGMDVGNRFYNRKTGEFDVGRANSEADKLQALMNVSGGFTTGNSIQSFFRSAGTMGQDISAEGLGRMSHFIEVNPRNAAQAIKSFINLFEGKASRMAKKDKAWWTAQGLYGPDGRLKDDAMLHSDPIGFAETYLRRFSRTDISSHTQRMNVGSILNETEGSQGNINRQAAAVARSDAQAASRALLDSPAGSVKLLDAAIARFSVTLGKFEAGPGIHILGQITDGIDQATKYLNAHPDSMKKFAGEVGDMIGGMVSVAEGFAKIGAMIPEWLRPILFGAAAGGAAASVVPGIGTGAGGVLGAAAAAAKEYWSYLHNNGYIKARDDRTPAAQPAGATHVTITVPLNVDGRHVATAVAPHINLMNQRNASQSLRASSSGADGLSMPQLPGAAWAH